MEQEIDITKRFADFLIQRGYPEDSILIEWKLSAKQHVDMGVIDNLTKQPIALFEFKQQRKGESESREIDQIKKYAENLGDTTIPLFMIFGSDNDLGFDIFYLTEENGKDTLKLMPSMPLFMSLKNEFLSKAVTKNENSKNRTFNWFKYICWLLAFFITFLLFFDFRGCISITPERLGVIAIICGLAIVPFAKKLNILGIEFKRLRDQKNAKLN